MARVKRGHPVLRSKTRAGEGGADLGYRGRWITRWSLPPTSIGGG